MDKSVDTPVNSLNASIADIQRRLPNMTLKAKIDLAARLKGVAKAAEEIDKGIKEEIKTKLKGVAGVVAGHIFRAVMRVGPQSRVSVQKLKVEYPRVYAKCLEKNDVETITFDVL